MAKRKAGKTDYESKNAKSELTDNSTDKQMNGKKKKRKIDKQENTVSVPQKEISGVMTKKVEIESTDKTQKGTKGPSKKQKTKKKKKYENSQGTITASEQMKKEGDEAKEESKVVEGEEDLSPEERRVLERKMKKILKKDEKKRKKEEGKDEKREEVKANIAEQQALEYLTCWSERRDQWKFQKTRQTWLLHHIYDMEKVSDATFSVLLMYMEGMQGASRNITVKQAESLVQEEDGEDMEAQRKTNRAREIIQLLSLES